MASSSPRALQSLPTWRSNDYINLVLSAILTRPPGIRVASDMAACTEDTLVQQTTADSLA